MTETKPIAPGRKESQGKLYLIPLRQIVGNTNPRNPLSQELTEQGYGVFKMVGRSKAPLWDLALSEDPEARKTYVNLIQKFDPEIASLGANILALGLLEAVEVRDNGCKPGRANTYTLVFGCRRALATLYNWCVLGRPAEPVIEARLAKGNEVTLLHRAVSENIRKTQTVIEEARAFRYALNNGEKKEELAKIHGISLTTVDNRLALLELPLDVQKKIEEGRLKPTKALEDARAQKQQEQGQAPAARVKVRPRKQIEEALEEFSEDTPVGKALRWVLGLREHFKI